MYWSIVRSYKTSTPTLLTLEESAETFQIKRTAAEKLIIFEGRFHESRLPYSETVSISVTYSYLLWNWVRDVTCWIIARAQWPLFDEKCPFCAKITRSPEKRVSHVMKIKVGQRRKFQNRKWTRGKYNTSWWHLILCWHEFEKAAKGRFLSQKCTTI